MREVSRRLIAPFNRVFEPLCDWSKPRVLLAIPGNHDWYDGLDGFARLCQAPCTFEEPLEIDDALHPRTEREPGARVGAGVRQRRAGAEAGRAWPSPGTSRCSRRATSGSRSRAGSSSSAWTGSSATSTGASAPTSRPPRARRGSSSCRIPPAPGARRGPPARQALAALDVVPARDPTLRPLGRHPPLRAIARGPERARRRGRRRRLPARRARLRPRRALPARRGVPRAARVVGDVPAPAVAPRARARGLGDHVALRDRRRRRAPGVLPREPARRACQSR